MKSISLNIRIKIPAIYYKHPFTDIPVTETYFDARGTENHTKYLEAYKLLPFLKRVQNLSEHFGERFKLGVSISGISIKLLRKYAPNTLRILNSLVEKGTIEFLAEPWSNSILPYYQEKELIHQTNLHRKSIQAEFDQTPTVFIADTAVNASLFSEFIPSTGCKTALTSSNHFVKKADRNVNGDSIRTGRADFLINHQLSNKLQLIVSDGFRETGSGIVAPFVRYLRKYVSLVKPLVLVFNPLAENIKTYDKWESFINLLLDKTGTSFYSLSDLEEVANYFYIMNDYSDAMLSQFKLADNWMRNSMQQEALKQLINIYRKITTGDHQYVPEAWDYLQDMDNYFYMSDSFFIGEFANTHFNPFRSPHEAFTSYINVVSNFWNIKKQSQENFFKTNFFIAPTIN